LSETGELLWGTSVELPEALPAAGPSRRQDEAPDSWSARGVIRDLPVAGGTLHLVATLLASNDDREALDRRETILRVEPSSLDQRGLLALRHDWEWRASTSAPADERAGLLFRR